MGSLLVFAASSYCLWQKNQLEVDQLQAYLGYHSTALAKMDTFQTLQVAQDQFGNLQGGSIISYHADLIVASIPKGIQLTALRFAPEQKKRSY
ncbi:MAG: hypothetical protein AAF705_04760 [Bacteroidota bacterium]